MADAVTTSTIHDGRNRIVVHLTNISDGTGETNVAKIDKSAIGVASDGGEADALDLESVRWCIQGMTSVRLLWDHGTDVVACLLSGSGFEDFLEAGGVKKDSGTVGDGTGDVLLTTNGAVSGGTYDITLSFAKRA
jgi:hypothetical protein